jgi:hypothetical protein
VFCCRSCFLGQALISIINTSLLSPVNTIHTTVLPTLVSHSSCPSVLTIRFFSLFLLFLFACTSFAMDPKYFATSSVTLRSHELTARVSCIFISTWCTWWGLQLRRPYVYY